MRLRELFTVCLALTVLASLACGTDPMVGPGTNTQYNLTLTITSPANGHVFTGVGDSVPYTFVVTNVANGLNVSNPTLTSEVLADTGVRITTCTDAQSNPFDCIKARGAGMTDTLTDTFINVNTGATLTATAVMSVP